MGRLVKDYDIAFVSTGDVLRKEIMAKSEVGKRAEEVVASGGESTGEKARQKGFTSDYVIGLVPDELMLDVVKAELDRLRGKVSSFAPWWGSVLIGKELDYRRLPTDLTSRRATRRGSS